MTNRRLGRSGRCVLAVLAALVFIVAVGGALFGIGKILHPTMHALRLVLPSLLTQLVPDFLGHALLVLAVVLLTFLFTRRRNALSFAGLPPETSAVRCVCYGVLVGVSIIGITALSIALFGRFQVLGWKNGLFDGTVIATLCLLTMLLVAASEELWFRGYALSIMERACGFWPAAIVSSLLFGLAHGLNPSENWASQLLIVVAGLLLCFLRRITGSLWAAVGLHAGVDYAQEVIFSGPDSGFDDPAKHLFVVSKSGPDWLTGGAAGLENSLVTGLLLLAAFALLFGIQRSKRRYLVSPAPLNA